MSQQDFLRDIAAKRDTMKDLDRTGTQLKYFSQKQDVTLIKNLLISVQNRWDRVQNRCNERSRQLDSGFKRSKQVGFVVSFHHLQPQGAFCLKHSVANALCPSYIKT